MTTRPLLTLALLASACGAPDDADPSPPPSDAAAADLGATADADPESPADAGPEAPLDAAASPDAALPPATLSEALAALHARPCPDWADFLCTDLRVPLNHNEPAGRSIDLALAVRPASSGPSQGLLVNVSGGPGYGGLAEMDDLEWLDPAIREAFDMVYFDLRGVDGSGGITCPEAAAAWYATGLRAATPEARTALAERAARFATDCPAEIAGGQPGGGPIGVPLEQQAFYDTTQAAHDIEAIRQALGGGLITLSGLSYGTQLSQTYVTLYPEHVRAAILDGAIDLTRTELDYVTGLGASVEDVLTRTLAACDANPDCAADFEPGTPASTYDDLATRLDAGPVAVDFPLADGDRRARQIDRVELDHLTTLAVYDEAQRSLLLRALAATRRERFVPLRRLLDAAGYIDEQSEAADYSGFSDAVYYTVTCNDYGHNAGGPAAFLEACAGATHTASAIEACFGDLPCATWPTTGDQLPRPAPFAPEGIPVLVINADADVATPVVQGRAVVEALRAAGAQVQAVEVRGGHHVMWGSDACVDEATHTFLFDPATPRADVTCPVGMLGFTLPLTPDSAAAYADAADFAVALSTELYALPWFPWASSWGCDAGGTGEVDDDGIVALNACSFVDGLSIDGGGRYDWDAESLNLTVDVTGEHAGHLEYFEDVDGNYTLTGTWDGAAVDE